VDIHVKAKIAEAVDAGLSTMAVDAQQCASLELAGIKLLFKTMQLCAELGVKCVLVGNPGIVAECKGFEDTRNWKFVASLDEARTGAAAA
jgi:two-component system cell cycle response regulator